ncbi:MAG TPA: ABC transporter permease [Acidimicrobiia bacterium]|nr:ABC transporter permease [Acidimicrobiia bacterium]
MRAVIAHARMELVLTLRRGESLLATLGIPVGVLVFFSQVDVVDTGFDEPLDFLVPGVLALAVVAAGMVSLGIATGFERRYGVLKRLGVTPLGRRGLVVAKIAAVVALELVQVLVLLAVAAVLGWDLPSGLAIAVGWLLAGTVAFGGLGLLMAGTLRAEGTLALTNGLYVAFILVGGVAVPLDRLPGWLAAVSKALPAAQLTEVVRGTLVAGADVPVWAWAGLLAWAVAAPALAAATFRFEE